MWFTSICMKPDHAGIDLGPEAVTRIQRARGQLAEEDGIEEGRTRAEAPLRARDRGISRRLGRAWDRCLPIHPGMPPRASDCKN
jgi:hypothetical protein